MSDADALRAFQDSDAHAIWDDLTHALKRRGWHLAVGCGQISIRIPGNGGPDTDRYIEVSD